jgi:hypothetical protein
VPETPTLLCGRQTACGLNDAYAPALANRLSITREPALRAN